MAFRNGAPVDDVAVLHQMGLASFHFASRQVSGGLEHSHHVVRRLDVADGDHSEDAVPFPGGAPSPGPGREGQRRQQQAEERPRRRGFIRIRTASASRWNTR
jgi:hypothetical protein